jgi:acetyl esterase/lipase
MQPTPVHVKTEVFKSTESGELCLDIHSTRLERQGCLLFLHGGALLLGSRTDISKDVVEFLNEQGWDVASMDYRLVPQTSLKEILSDVKDGCEYARNQYVNEPFFVVGYSAGAYLALLNGAHGYSVDGICAFAGYGDLGAEWYYTPSEFFLQYKNVDDVPKRLQDNQLFLSDNEKIDLYIYLRQTGRWPEFVFGKGGIQDGVKKYSPILSLPKEFPPTVLIHGDNDNDVPISASREMASALASKGIPYQLITPRGFDHDLYEQVNEEVVRNAWREGLLFLQSQLPRSGSFGDAGLPSL